MEHIRAVFLSAITHLRKTARDQKIISVEHQPVEVRPRGACSGGRQYPYVRERTVADGVAAAVYHYPGRAGGYLPHERGERAVPVAAHGVHVLHIHFGIDHIPRHYANGLGDAITLVGAAVEALGKTGRCPVGAVEQTTVNALGRLVAHELALLGVLVGRFVRGRFVHRFVFAGKTQPHVAQVVFQVVLVLGRGGFKFGDFKVVEEKLLACGYGVPHHTGLQRGGPAGDGGFGRAGALARPLAQPLTFLERWLPLPVGEGMQKQPDCQIKS